MLMPRDEQAMLVLRPLLQQSAEGPMARPVGKPDDGAVLSWLALAPLDMRLYSSKSH